MKPIYDLDAEFAVISSILQDDRTTGEALTILSENDFYEPMHKIIFKTIQTMNDLGKKIDLTTICSFLKKEQQLDIAGGSIYLTKFIRGTINPGNIIWYANIVREKSLKREIQKRNMWIQKQPESDKIEIWLDEMIELARAIPSEILSIKNINNLLPDIMRKIEERIASGKGVEGYKTNFTSFDKMTLGLRRKELFIIAARTGVGKTCLGLNFAANFAKQQIPVLFFSFEMGIENLNERLLASESRIEYNKIISGDLDDREILELNDVKLRIHKLPLNFVDDYNRNISKIEKTIREFKLKNDEFICIIDYLQQVITPRGNTREQEVADVSSRLKSLAMDNNILLIALAQLSRAAEKHSKPILSDLRESGAIEQDADGVLFIHRDSEKMIEESATETAELILAKRRNGMIGKTKLTFHKHYTRFDNYTDKPYIP